KTRGIGGALVRGRDEPVTAFSARTDGAGNFSLGLPDGTHVVTAQGGGCRDMRRPIDDPLGTELHVVVAGGRVTRGASVGSDGAAALPTIFMDCSPLPQVTVVGSCCLSGSFGVLIDGGDRSEPLTIHYRITGNPDLAGEVTVTVEPGDDYDVGSPAAA